MGGEALTVGSCHGQPMDERLGNHDGTARSWTPNFGAAGIADVEEYRCSLAKRTDLIN